MKTFFRPLAVWIWLVSTLLAGAAHAAPPQTADGGNDTDPPADAPSFESYDALVLADQPVARWTFDKLPDGEARPVWQLPAEVRGKATFDGQGPSADISPLQPKSNAALVLDGKSYLVVKDPGEKSPLDFGLGDTLTIEAWVNPTKIGNSQYAHIVSKGRTGNSGAARDNQNYALRLQGVGGAARVSFLFRDERNRPGNGDDWHRWTSQEGFAIKSGWHHIVVSYTFGEPDSLVGWMDGYPMHGVWDMGKQTKLGPVVDDDELWIGSAMGGQSGSSFTGQIDEVAIYRTTIPEERIHLRCPPLPGAAEVADEDIPPGQVLVQIHEGVPDVKNWLFRVPESHDSYTTDLLAFPEVPRKYSQRAIQIDRTNPFLVRAHCLLRLPAGRQRLLLRSLNGTRVFVDGEELVRTPFHTISSSAHGRIRRVAKVPPSEKLRMLQTGENEELCEYESDGGLHRVTMEMFVGGGTKRPELGEVSLSLETAPGEFEILGPERRVSLTDHGWFEFLKEHQIVMTELNARRRQFAGAAEQLAWDERHTQAQEQIRAELPQDYTPGDSAVIDRLVERDLAERGVEPQPLSDDWSFLRRVTLDVIGTVPTAEQIDAYFNDPSADRRANYIERLLQHPGWADHWVGYWQDVLAENPNIVNPTLNNTGPFRWWIHESFLDNKPIDRFVTELVRMEGSEYYGGPAGFGMASQNDAPMAAKAHILGTAFLGVQMKCARCHDAPFHDVDQRDLFAMAAMLRREPQEVPKTSTINLSEDAVKSLIVEVSLKPGEKVPAEWTFEDLSKPEQLGAALGGTDDSRERLAALITSPANHRFREVIVNRLWQRYLGRGFVEPVDDWEFADPSHPDVMAYLSRELVLSGYDLKHVARLILNSHTYQRAPVAAPLDNADDVFVFAGPVRRRMSAEQLVDSIFVASGKDFHAGEMNIDVDGARAYTSSLNLGRPARAWQFTSTSNERDRPSLSLPLSQEFVSLMQTLGWRASRQDPLTVREATPTVLQPAILANGVVGRRFTRLSEDGVFTQLALQEQPVEDLVRAVFLRSLCRPPAADELTLYSELLAPGYDDRRIDVDPDEIRYYYPQTTLVSWSNHLDPEANTVKIEQEEEVRRGDPPTIRLQSEWRERMEDMLWAILNTPEFVVVP